MVKKGRLTFYHNSLMAGYPRNVAILGGNAPCSALMAAIFPELKTFSTGSVSTVVPVSLVTAYPTPALLAEAPAEEVRQVLWKARGYQHAHRMAELQALAGDSSGLLPDVGRV
jgi:hypothetical protein